MGCGPGSATQVLDDAYNPSSPPDVVQGYSTATDGAWEDSRYERKSRQMKRTKSLKLETYFESAEEIEDFNTRRSLKKRVIDTTKGFRLVVNDDVYNIVDPDRKRMMQKFEGAIVTDPQVSFADVVGLEQAKEALKEAVILPVKFPQLFQGKRKPWAGILLYGPPGTGKSYLAKAIATECKSTFISVSSSDLLSKWLGESEKGVKCLFELARERQPCIVFIDEIASFYSRENSMETELLRRLKAEFLVQMQGLQKNYSNVFILAATNIPWAVDKIIWKQFEKRISISLPDVDERLTLFKMHIGANTSCSIKEEEWMELAKKTRGYSADDIAVVCREGLMGPIRQLVNATHFKLVLNLKRDEPRYLWMICLPGEPDAVKKTLDAVRFEELLEPPVTMRDMLAALRTQKRAIDENELFKHSIFNMEFGVNDF